MEIGGAERGRKSVVADVVRAKAIDGRYSRHTAELFGDVVRHGRMLVGSDRSGGTEIQVGLELIVHPDHHGLTETANHDANRSHHPDRGGQSADKDRRPAKRAGQAARAEQTLDADQDVYKRQLG